MGNSVWRKLGEGGTLSDSMRGTLSKWVWTGTEMVERDEINEEITSGDAGSTVEEFFFLAAWDRDLRRRDSREECATAPPFAEGAIAFSMRSMAPLV